MCPACHVSHRARAATVTLTGQGRPGDEWEGPFDSALRAAGGQGVGKFRYVVEQTSALLHHFKRLAVRWKRGLELHNAFLSLASSLICWRRLRKTGS
jgi:hypothetical protein